jgi:hypothetical protein
MVATTTSGYTYFSTDSGLSWSMANRYYLSRVLLLASGTMLFGQQAELGDGFEEYGSLLTSSQPGFTIMKQLGPDVNAGTWLGFASSYDGAIQAAVQYFGYIWNR